MLDDYLSKRDFDKTPEPRGGGEAPDADGPIFVIQEHDASSHHWDLRLEVDGVLKSWALPKGPSTDPSEKRLAIQTEDHPLEYANFEGLIPEDQYGGGAVIVWDAGTYEPLDERAIEESLEDGHAKMWLAGEKLEGGWLLQRFKPDEEPDQWLFIKLDDDKADARRNPTSTEPESVLSDRTLEEVEDGDS